MENEIPTGQNEQDGPTPGGIPGEAPGPTSGEAPEGTKLQVYRAVCAKLGLVMSLYFVCRILIVPITGWVYGFAGDIGDAAAYAIGMAASMLFAYVIPMIFTAALFKSFSRYKGEGGLRELYKKPRRIARALGTFPAMYGLGYGTALLTILVTFLLSKLTGWQTIFEDVLRPTVMEPSSDLAGALMVFFVMVVIAPVFEELWVRGIMYDALKPFGCGMAIIISSILFGLLHGSLQMLFYTTALGFALGYVRYATGSLFIPTILHAIINSVAAGLLFITSMTGLALDGNKLLNTAMSVYILAMLILIVVGLTAFIRRIPVIRKYRFGNEWSEIGAGKKTALFFTSIPVIIMLILAINEHSRGWFLNKIFG